MSATLVTPKTTSGGEIVRELVNASDGAGLHFDGAAGHVEATALSFSDLTKYSFEVVFSTEDATTSCVLIGNSNSSTARKVLGFKDGILRLGYKEGSWAAVSGGTIEANTVYHVVATRDGTTQKIYVNGNEVTTGTLDSIYFGATAALRLAYSGDSTDKQHFTGTLYRARVYNRALSSSEVQTAYERADVDYSSQYGSQSELVTNGDFASSSGWSVQSVAIGSNVSTWTDDGSTLQFVRRADWTITKGKKYRLQFTVSSFSGAGSIGLFDYARANRIADNVSVSANGTVTAEFTAQNSSSSGALLGTADAANNIAAVIDDLSCVQIGCVSDYDLAFANPKNSFKINDRSGAADGTASNDGTNPTGISQVQVIKQLNATAARIGTTAATPADGEVIAGSVTAKTSTTGGITIDASGQTDTTARFELKADRPSADQDACDIRFYNNNAQPIAVIAAVKGSGANDTDGKLDFYTSNEKRLTIDSTGAVKIGSIAMQGDALLGVRANGDSINFGHSNQNGYGSNLGCGNNNGHPYLAFMCEHGTNNNTFRTRGEHGNVIQATATGELKFSQVTTHNADNQTPVDRLSISSTGLATFSGDTKLGDGLVSNYVKHVAGLDDTVAISFTFPSQSSRYIHQMLELRVAMGDDAAATATPTFLRYAFTTLTTASGITQMDASLGSGITASTGASGTTLTVTLTEGSAIAMDSVTVFATVTSGHGDAKCTGMTVA